MSKDAAVEEAEEPAEGAEAPALPKKNRKKLVIIALAALLVLGGGGGGAWYFLSSPAEEDKIAAEAAETPEEFVDVPAMQVSLRGSDGSSRMLKLHVMLVPGEKTPEEIEPRLPLLVDRYQSFLRELRPEDMAGSAATFRIKEELLIRANQALGARAVRDVLIQDLMQA
ncbi:flagellar basal body-associated FliL family protein [Sphingomonas glaciei]|uniref:Flagellar protein FliL n=1 Tax=Sphingomonas glaciei TaxID=2938948 RepID=A0ABY5MSP1_9SPHN|nr:flagellar basal body-associated FliL family protein [Sphingomonas glaciei]UUR07509.1 flagellar basal body-associated FliL family protein [Sphingomonas glaciei]